jgi:hypothetical protein
VKAEFLSIPCVLILTTLAAQLRQFTGFSVLKFGYLKEKLFLVKNKLPPNQLENVTVTVTVTVETVNANPVAGNNNVAVNSLKTAPMKPRANGRSPVQWSRGKRQEARGKRKINISLLPITYYLLPDNRQLTNHVKS